MILHRYTCCCYEWYLPMFTGLPSLNGRKRVSCKKPIHGKVKADSNCWANHPGYYKINRPSKKENITTYCFQVAACAWSTLFETTVKAHFEKKAFCRNPRRHNHTWLTSQHTNLLRIQTEHHAMILSRTDFVFYWCNFKAIFREMAFLPQLSFSPISPFSKETLLPSHLHLLSNRIVGDCHFKEGAY